ncbi:Na/Pi cotransporter family protein [Geomobilimonas luticola]|uniref:Na/Pi cotransporter family protein n=1 Tax=Geomobilimonas luticola TaxID=1114878 RepID=A0ABS5SDC9_9BACT|nr:Na/Pi cotransporter family protein [Geomobilimonas luticola]MBT0653180.1 Na/Pi cotransporter family protein [Geomobilimonas luticola]
MPLMFLWEALGGLGLFILGMKSMSEGLQRIAGERLRQTLEKVTGNRLTAALMGSSLASLLQSSSAAAIIIVGLLNAGLLSVYQALGVLMGTGIGTTLAIQFIAFKVSQIALPAIALGVFLKYFCKRRRVVYAGELLLGAGLIFFGLQLMESGFAPVKQSALFQAIQHPLFSWHISSVLLGALLTFLIQSGSAVIGIVIALAGSGLIGFESGVAMVVGEVLGTSLITLVATIGGTMAARRSAIIYGIINVVAITLVLIGFPLFLKAVQFLSPGDAEFTVTTIGSVDPHSVLSRPNIARHLANAHTLFSVLSVLVFLPFLGFFTRSAARILPGVEGGLDYEPRPKFIDARILNTPSIALLQAKNETRRMAAIAESMFEDVVKQFYKYDARRTMRIKQKEETLDVLQRDISNFLVSLSKQSAGRESFLDIPLMLQIISSLEHIGDQSEAVLDYLRRKKEDKIIFSAAAMTELRNLAAVVGDLVSSAIASVPEPAADGLPAGVDLRDRVTHLQGTMLDNHIKRLTDGDCTVMAGLIYSDIVGGFSKIADACIQILKSEREFSDAAASGSH